MMRRITVLLSAVLAGMPFVAVGQPSAAPKPPQAVAALNALKGAKPAPQVGAYAWTTGAYQYDGAGNIFAIGPQQFGYDTVNRLTYGKVIGPTLSSEQSFYYDEYGNMTSRVTGGTPHPISVDAATNHLSATGVAYDDAGNLTQFQPDGSGHLYHFTYDALNMMKGEKLDSETTHLDYIYTADDERIAVDDRTTGISHWKIRGLGKKVLADFQLQGTTWTLSRDYAYRDGVLLAAFTPSLVHHMSVDHLGSPRLVTDANGVKVAFHTYLPFGEEMGVDTSDGESLKFTGHERDLDPANGNFPLDYMHARYYAAMPGRFLSVDPVVDIKTNLTNPQGWNRYSYVRNNPLRWTDPTGNVIAYDDAFRKRVKTDETFRKAFEAWKQTKSGAAQWKAMGQDKNTVYKFSVGRVDAPTGFMRTEQANGRTLPIVFAQNENKSGKLDQPNVNMTINADFVESRYRNIPSMTVPAMARALFEEASHGLDIGSGTKSAKEAWDAEPKFNTGTEPRMQQFERELKDIVPPPEGN
jgi:RHS repeat-associated protein